MAQKQCFLGKKRRFRRKYFRFFGGVPPFSVKKKSIKNWPKNSVFWAKNAVFGEKNSVFGPGPARKGGGGVPPLSVNFFPLTFWENVVRDGPGGGGTPLTDDFRDWGF